MASFENAFKAIDNTLRHDPGCSTALDYVEQSTWVLFLKYLDDLELTRQQSAALSGSSYSCIIEAEYRWDSWAMPRGADGGVDRSHALTGDDLIEFVNTRLFPYLKGFKERFTPDTIEHKVGIIFDELKNKIASGYNLRDVIERVEERHFQTIEERHEMSALYESRLSQMGNAGRNGGEYYTPRPLIRTIIRALNPRLGSTFYDGAAGSCGFLCEAYLHMRPQAISTADNEQLQHRTFYGKELKGLAYIIGMMNMILHGIESPNVVKTNTLAESLEEVQARDQYDYIGANPPFGGNEREEVQQNFPIHTGETAYMFLQHFIKRLKAGGRAGIVIKNTFLSNTDNASIALRRKLITDCRLDAVLDLPSGVFSGAGVKTVVLFFTKGEPTQQVWYYQIDKHFTKTHPLTERDLEDFLALLPARSDSDNSWTLRLSQLDDTLDMSVKNPHKIETTDDRTPRDILAEIDLHTTAATSLLKEIKKML